jgi:hypothetical protein
MRRLLILIIAAFLLLASTACASSHWAPANRAAHTAQAGAIGVHSMLYVNSPASQVETMFSEAKALGAKQIRLDIALVNVFPSPGITDWSGVDRFVWESHKYGIPILADLVTTPMWLAQNGDYQAPPTDDPTYGTLVAAIVQHTQGTIHDFEAWNEPDGPWSFHGSPADYGRLLAADYAAVHGVAGDRLALGGIMVPTSTSFVDQALAVPGARFDITNIHVRTCGMQNIANIVTWWRAKYGKPLWVTEMGYPADPQYQGCTNYRGGASAQAAYDHDAILAMWGAGASQVFVTGRDEGSSGFAASEGIEHLSPFFRRPAWNTIHGMT